MYSRRIQMKPANVAAAYVEGVRSVLDPNPMPPGLYQYSVIISTPQREMKFTAPTKERHDIWLSVRLPSDMLLLILTFFAGSEVPVVSAQSREHLCRERDGDAAESDVFLVR